MKTILAAIDFSPVSEQILQLAVRIASATNAEIYLLHVLHSIQDLYIGFSLANQEYFGSMSPLYVQDENIVAQLREKAQEEEALLKEYAAKARAQGCTCTPLLLQGDVAKVLVEEAGRLSADLCILGTHGRSLVFKALLGSTSEYVTKHSLCPVTLVPSPRES